MALRLLSIPSSPSSSSSLSNHHTTHFSSINNTRRSSLIQRLPRRTGAFPIRGSLMTLKACVKLEEEEKNIREGSGSEEWGKVSAVLFDMDGVLCNSEHPSRRAAVDLFAEMGVEATVDDFVPFTGTGEANFLGGVASLKGVKGFDTEAAKKRFYEIYLDKYAKPNSGFGFPGALELITQCKSNGLKVAVASSADRIKVDANLAAAGLSLSMFDAIVSADAFENLKPAPDIFLAASKILNVPPSECVVIEDALAGVQAANAAEMRCIAVTTTLLEETLKTAGPSFIKKDIGSISFHDILNGVSDCHNERTQGPHFSNPSAQTSSAEFNDSINTELPRDMNSSDDGAFSIGGLQGSRRDVVRYGSLGIAISCLLFTVSNWKAMQYASPKAISNMLFGITRPSFTQNEGQQQNERIQQFVNYISDLENRGAAPIVPEFPPKLDWLNTPPLQLRKDLRGKVVLLDFWTYCCINCMHVLPDLEFLEKKYKDMPFTVVGVHSAKFDNEKDLEAIRNAVLRYGITHPVVNDGDMYLWRELGVSSWPTFAIVGPNGKLIAQIAGEGRRKKSKHHRCNSGKTVQNSSSRQDDETPQSIQWNTQGQNTLAHDYTNSLSHSQPSNLSYGQLNMTYFPQDLDNLVEAALLFYGERKILDNTPVPLSLEKDNDPRLLTSPLKFPGKLAVDVLNNRLFVSDSNHNRIVVTDLDGNFIVQIGSTGEEGLRDGTFDDAAFNRPQGLAYNTKKNLLYVADTENHALREIDFVNETVRTLAGNGIKGSDYRGGVIGPSQLLNSPWDVCFEPINEIVYIAMAGQHQIWEHNTTNGVTRAFSGDGYERNLNGSSSTSTSFAQPSGTSLSPDLKELYVADSESSSIRALDLKTGGSRLLAGGDPVFSDNLFKFGDHDGIGSEVLLQHPLGVLCGKNGQLYIADSYNHKIKKLDLVNKRVSTLAGTGKAGFKDGLALAAQLSEPSGLVEADGRLFIADTNNSLIRYLDLNKEEAELLTLEMKGVQPPTSKPRSMKRLRRRFSADAQTIKVDGGSSSEGNLCLKISVPEGYHFSKEARSKFNVELDPENAVLIDPLDGSLSPEGSAVLHFKRSSSSASMGRIYCKVYYCKEDEVCLYQSLVFEVPFREEIPESSPAEITLAHEVKPKTTTSSLQLPVAR